MSRHLQTPAQRQRHRHRRRAVAVAVAVALAVASLAAAAAVVAAPDAAPAPGALASSLTPAQLAGQRIIYAYAGLTPPAQLLARIRAGEAAGVIFFSTNIASSAQIRAVIASFARANAASPVHAPLLLMTDQEGGPVRRLAGAPAASEQQIGASPDGPALAAQAGSGAAATLRGAAMNVNLAPVLDVFRARGDFIDQYGRAYSSDPALTARLGAAFIVAQQRAGVAAAAKHFPGLGAATTAQNTDEGPVTLNVGLSALRAVDEAPYRAAIRAGVKLVMVSWAVYPALDRSAPAGLSAAVIGGELRNRLGFRGVTITDGLGAGALARYGGFSRRGALAAQAGADLLLCSTVNPADDTPANGVAALQGVLGALTSGRLSRVSAAQAAARVIALRASL